MMIMMSSAGDCKGVVMTGSGRKPSLPAQADPAPTPQSIQEGAATAGEQEARLRKRKRGRRSLILTEGGLGIPQQDNVQKKSLLG